MQQQNTVKTRYKVVLPRGGYVLVDNIFDALCVSEQLSAEVIINE